jgi:hypothetical protein
LTVGAAGDAAGTAGVTASDEPHWLQNFDPAACSASHSGQGSPSVAPHSEQNLAFASLS